MFILPLHEYTCADGCNAGNVCEWCKNKLSEGKCATLIFRNCARTPNIVCGCDNQSYLNDCFRRGARIASSIPGNCTCGSEKCSDQEFCDSPEGFCLQNSKQNKCVPFPSFTSCRDNATISPVCGCGDVEFAKDCLRIMARVRLKHKGKCKKKPAVCDPNPTVFTSVCGVDGKRYRSDCERQQAGVDAANNYDCFP